MTDIDVRRPTPVWRRFLGGVVLLVGLMYAAVIGYGAVNSGRYVVLQAHFHNPLDGAFALLGALLIAWILAFPVRSSVIDRRRSQVRTTLIILTVIAAIGFVFVYVERVYRYDPRVIATSPSGQRSIAIIHSSDYQVHVLAGTGIGQRDVGSFGVPCGLADGIEATFVGENEVKISTVYNNYDFRLSPAGVPQGHFGAMCGV